MTDRKEREAAFLHDLAELTRKHGLVIWSSDACFEEPKGDLSLGSYAMNRRDAIEWRAAQAS